MLLSRHKRPGAYARRASSVKKTIKNQFVWRRHCLTLSLGKPILFPKKGDCQGVLRSRRRETSRCIGCSSVGAAVREWPRQAGRLAAGAGVTLGAPLMAVGRPSSHGEDFNYKSLAAVAHTPGWNGTPVAGNRGVGQPSQLRIGCVGGGHAGSIVVAGSWKGLICWDWAVGI